MTQFVQFSFQGLALGAIYALVALGFVIIYKSTGVINFAQGELMLLGAYLVWAFQSQAGLPFFLAVPLALIVMAATGWGIERTILRRMVGRPVYAVVMITIALAIVIHQMVTGIWGFGDKILRTPWSGQFTAGGVRFGVSHLMTLLVVGLLVLAFFGFFRYSRAGVAMRATAFDQEAALAVGIPVTRVYAWSWMIAAVLATVAGVFLADLRSALLFPGLSFVALRAFPAAILGGLDSPGGAVVGGLMIGWVELMVQAYQPQFAPWLGENVHVVAAYAVMIIVLILRPYGLFGTKEVQRV